MPELRKISVNRAKELHRIINHRSWIKKQFNRVSPRESLRFHYGKQEFSKSKINVSRSKKVLFKHKF